MNNLRKKLLIIIIVMFVVILLLFSLINLLKKKDELGTDYGESELEKINTYESNQEIIEVNNKNKYYAIEKILNTYVLYIKQMKGIIDFQKYEDQEVKNQGVSQLYDILDEEYIQEFDIEKEDLQDKIKEYKDYDLKINKMYMYEKTSSINIYFVYASIDNEELNLLIKTDSENMTFSIFLDDYIKENEYYTEMNSEDISISENNIEKNDSNQYRYVNITDEYVVIQYMNTLKDSIINDTEYVYNKLLDKEYKDKRFAGIDNFLEYIQDNKEEFENIEIKKYLVNYFDDYVEYVCIDQYDNTYIFKESAIMNFTFKLDNYTIATDKFKETYDTAEDEKKVQMNIDKFFQMINRHDYKSSYNCLADNFKDNYFNTEEEFEEYAKDRFFSYNKIEFKKYDKKGNGIYVFELELNDLLEEDDETRNISIIMQLEDDMNFKMSFDM